MVSEVKQSVRLVVLKIDGEIISGNNLSLGSRAFIKPKCCYRGKYYANTVPQYTHIQLSD